VKLPEAPFLELNFYYANKSEQEAFAQLSYALNNLGSKLDGEGYAHKGVNIKGQAFASITDDLMEAVTFDPNRFEETLADQAMRLMQVHIHDALDRQDNDVIDILTYVSISKEASLIDKHPIAIWTDGTAFDPIPGQEIHARRLGRLAYQRFLALIRQTEPSYAAITVEYALECPTDLRARPESLAFEDFFISNKYLSDKHLNTISELYTDAYVEMIDVGIYVSCYGYFNPRGISLHRDIIEERAVKVSRMIGFNY